MTGAKHIVRIELVIFHTVEAESGLEAAEIVAGPHFNLWQVIDQAISSGNYEVAAIEHAATLPISSMEPS